MAEGLENSVKVLMSSLENMITTKTIIGEPIQYKDVVVFPMADVSFGVAAGAADKENKNSGAGGAGAKISPSAVLVIQNGTSKLVNIKDKDSLNKLIELIPDIINKLSSAGESRKEKKKKGKAEELPVSEETVELAEEVLAEEFPEGALEEELPNVEEYI